VITCHNIKNATAKKQIHIASFISIDTDVAGPSPTSDLCPANSALHKY